MNITHMRYAVEVARTGSISQAAENLAVGQPNLSKALKELESHLGATLFHRTSKGAVPTSQGQVFLHYAESVLSQLDEMKRLFVPDSGDSPALRIAATPSAVLAQAIADASVTLDATQSFSLREGDRATVMQAVADGQADIGFLRCPASERDALMRFGEGLGLSVLPLRHTPPVVLMSREHPLAASCPLLLPELAAFVRLSDGEKVTTWTQAPTKRSVAFDSDGPVWELTSPAARLSVLALRPDTYCFEEPLPPLLLARFGLTARSCVGADREWIDFRVLPNGCELPKTAGRLLDALGLLWREASAAITP